MDRDERGLWQALGYAELGASQALNPQLLPFHAAIEACFECGVAAPTLTALNPPSPVLDLSALFLKRCLGDLRTTWLLLLIGYTPQAATIAASAFENAFTVVAILANPQQAPIRVLSDERESPWQPQELCKIRAATRFKLGTTDFEKEWRQFYAAYKWLCKIKHPTAASAKHEAGATATSDDGEFAVMAAPDIRGTDLSNKATVLVITTNHILHAIYVFASARKVDYSDERADRWMSRMEAASKNMKDAYATVMENAALPFNLYNTKLELEYRKLVGLPGN